MEKTNVASKERRCNPPNVRQMSERTISMFVLILLLLCVTLGCDSENRTVVIYTSLDQIYSEPIFDEFERNTGIKVKPVYDTEAAKTTGLVNRLIAEKDNPQADVFWNNEIARTLILKKKGVLSPYRSPSSESIPAEFKDKDGFWTGFAARARVLICNTKLLDGESLPASIFDLTDPKWKGRVALGNPLFGTTATHVAALFLTLGEDSA
ncbi:MAG: extracellular solute-binding protein, partial [Candidatus Zixiibacteriota bacterium]